MKNKKLNKLIKKHQSIKEQLQEIQAEERNIRTDIERILVADNKDSLSLELDNKEIKIKRNKNYSLTKDSVLSIKSKIDKDSFDALFTVSFKLKPSAYNQPTLKKKVKKVIKPFLTVKDAPLSIIVKDIE